MKPVQTLTLCMGSSCFSKGNNLNAAAIENFIRENELTETISIQGCLCEQQCKNGPNIRIGDELIQGVQPGMLHDLLAHKIRR
ncbi:(2Fe-2S) ferredoxin domain-containing protein [Desulfobotulus alkaliphilus]|uniref:(2Fe-2S) ferredoxin domain-containing protein n=1 Tax=Desulfobotulus alkaliphilus TaxID=622671 RepID=UPI001C969077|nr:(2Fe-2S) ferredoxin domain-containing protein [Desulfobotulus alkaliphilus]